MGGGGGKYSSRAAFFQHFCVRIKIICEIIALEGWAAISTFRSFLKWTNCPPTQFGIEMPEPLFLRGLTFCCHAGAPVFPRRPADVLSFPGSCFVRTDQLDGETDWKLRLPVACTQRLPTAAVSGPLSRTLRISVFALSVWVKHSDEKDALRFRPARNDVFWHLTKCFQIRF